VVFYIGRSRHPLMRLLDHIRGGDSIGNTIKDNLPLSLHWVMEMYTLEECTPMVQTYLPSNYPYYCSMLQRSHPMIDLSKDLADIAELAMIEHYTPCLNIMGKRKSSPLPLCYVNASKIANEGVKLG
jgi:hypothetical protein